MDLNWRPSLGGMRRLGGPAENSARAVAARLEVSLEARRPRVSPPEFFAGRTGYADAFLNFELGLPVPVGHKASDVLPVGGDRSGRLNYLHFTVVMSRSRKLALFAACNISGGESKSVERAGDFWALDGRISPEDQVGSALYIDNELDRGHLVRREDPNWGSQEEAEQANQDTFHYTNCMPQMAAFNRKTWLSLEKYVLSEARVSGDRVTVFSGPVFGAQDPEYRGVRIPTAYWKVLAFVDAEGHPSATAYMIDQSRELSSLEASYGRFKIYQRSVLTIERLSGLEFGSLADFDGFSNEERRTGTRIEAVLNSPADIRV